MPWLFFFYLSCLFIYISVKGIFTNPFDLVNKMEKSSKIKIVLFDGLIIYLLFLYKNYLYKVEINTFFKHLIILIIIYEIVLFILRLFFKDIIVGLYYKTLQKCPIVIVLISVFYTVYFSSMLIISFYNYFY